ncbi:MAG: SDR family oxidoreductase [Rhodospirillales bacterium]|nr:SDR family oxidoreductase [Rhodospirillales bacterium]
MSPHPHLQPRRRLFCFGLGYSASRLARALIADGWAVAGTCRTAEAAAQLRADGIDAHLFDGVAGMDHMDALLAGATHLLSSVPPEVDGDPVLRLHGADIARCAGLPTGLKWVGYLSTTGAYGDTGGAWVDEAAPVAPTGDRGKRRVHAERQWLGLFGDRVGNGAAAIHVFRLAGIYGPGRSALDAARRGASHRIIKPGHVFSRIHVDDIAAVLRASMDRPNPGAIYNVCDNFPAPSAEITSFACKLLGIAPPPEIAFEDADLSPMAKSFYADNRRVRNNRIRDELGVTLTYPDYETGLRAIFAGEE